MRYIEMLCHPVGGVEINEILIALLSEVGFESFSENEDGTLKAYIQFDTYTPDLEERLQSKEFSFVLNSFEIQEIADQNWNALWESQYDPVHIDGICLVRAPFHTIVSDVAYDIVIMPKMSFGTAHHETTKMMIQYLLRTEVSGKSLLDMGSGTAVLAILARMKGANQVTAIDNDEWAYNNALENVNANNFGAIEVFLGDSGLLHSKHFDVILANINRNILLNDIPVYTSCLNKNGILIMSGFYSEDLPLIEAKAVLTGLKLVSSLEKNNWVAACFSFMEQQSQLLNDNHE